MKLIVLATCASLAVASCPFASQHAQRLNADDEFKPLKLRLNDLQAENSHDFEQSLSAFGLVAVDLGPEFGALRFKSLEAAQSCIQGLQAPAEETFQDGTRRFSVAVSIEPGFKTQNLDACADIDKSFRQQIHAATALFADRLGEVYDLEHATQPLLSTNDSTINYATVTDVLQHGQHLEHFHSYRKERDSNELTIPTHTDQGLFIAFVPPVNLDADGDGLGPLAKFWIEMRDGSKVRVPIESEDFKNCVFFLLGDGVEQYLNGLLGGGGPALRSCPHALEMTSAADGHRVWYGLMILPPSDAVSPTHGLTYGKLRRLAIEDSGDEEAVSMGCSRNLFARELAATSCETDQLFCWARCMPLFDHYGQPVSEEICQDQGYSFFNCTDPARLVSDGTEHGDFYPGCTNYTFETAAPTIAPADEEGCTDAFLTAVAKAKDENFGQVTLEYAGPPWAHIDPPVFGGYLFWTVVDTQTTKSGKALSMRMLYPGRFGWFSMGMKNEGGNHNGMNGAHIVMAIPGRTDVSEVATYVIDENNSAFRWWSTPIATSDLTATSLSQRSDHCVTEFAFTISEFNEDYAFDPTEGICHQLLWGVSTDTVYEYDPLFLHGGYHEARGSFEVDFSKVNGACDVVDDRVDDTQDDEARQSKKKKKQGESITMTVVIVVVFVAIAVLALLRFVFDKISANKTNRNPVVKEVEAQPVSLKDEETMNAFPPSLKDEETKGTM